MKPIKALLERHASLVRARSPWDSLFSELKDLVRPDTADFPTGSTSSPGSERRRMFDGTAPWALEQLASGLHSSVTSPVDRFFSLSVVGMTPDELSHDAKVYLEMASDEIYARYNDPRSNFHPSFHEGYLDIGAFGTAAIHQEYDVGADVVIFRAFPLSCIHVDEDSRGRVDTVHRTFKMSVRQIEQQFGFVTEKMRKLRPDDMLTVVHCVWPNEDYNPGLRTVTSRRYASSYICKDTEEMLMEGGVSQMPYHVPRWTKLAGETYGRSPALAVLPEIRMVNTMRHTIIRAAQKIVDPPLMVPDDGFLLPVRTRMGGINYFRAGTDPIIPLETKGRVDIGVEMLEMSRQAIRSGFFVDWLVRPQKKERQTAQEIMDDRNQMLQMMGPIVGRLNSELIGPAVALTFHNLVRTGRIPEPPEDIAGSMDITFTSPAAKAQYTTKGQGIQAFLGQVTQLLPVLPGISDVINEEKLTSVLADVTDVSRIVLNSPDETQRRRKMREDQAALSSMSEAAPAVGKTAKDLAQAGALGPGLGL